MHVLAYIISIYIYVTVYINQYISYACTWPDQTALTCSGLLLTFWEEIWFMV